MDLTVQSPPPLPDMFKFIELRPHCTQPPPNHIRSNLLVSTYVVCERLSVMHEPAGVVEILVQILQFTPIL